MRLGVHVSIEGGLCEALKRAKALGCTCMQIFSRSPRNWAAVRFDPLDIQKFKKQRAKLDITPLVVHIPYLINLSSPEKFLYERSIAAFIEDVKTADKIGAEYFVAHLGSHKGMGEAYGIKRYAEGLNAVIDSANPKLMILLEVTAGSGNWLGYKFQHLRDIIKKVSRQKAGPAFGGQRQKIGICLDTAHILAAGYDITNKKGLDNTLKDFDKLIGIEKLKLIHLNDSMSPLGSRVDRHEHIGQGHIGAAGMKSILRHPAFKNLAFILETPKDTKTADKKNLAVVRKLSALSRVF